MLGSLPEVLKLIESRTIGPLQLEGVTARHPAMKAAKKLVADVRRLRGLVESLRPQGHVSASKKWLRHPPTDARNGHDCAKTAAVSNSLRHNRL